ncbi:hypothetical protein Bca4012_044625 [Brassica carinata]|uniref:Uncharacterized protein n=1 Tax=Brassica carinata TaxID=52824 RepID=A0A8X7QSF9_BRACI|nr:hypothetical protein Bca52824_057891 [Brassica carinata]
MTFFYVDLVRQRRNEFWTELKSIGLNRNGGWGLAGNFNEFMSSEKKLGGPVRVESSFYKFRSMARICKIKEIPSSGDKLSWAGVREVITNGVKENLRLQLEEEETKLVPDLVLIAEIKLQLTHLYQEESFWKQKCKNKWLVAGDLNTKVFHGWAKSRKMKNLIHALVDSGVEQTKEDA